MPEEEFLRPEQQCEYCGAALIRSGSGAVQVWQHPGGVCPEFLVLSVEGETLTFVEFKALLRVARAQLEIEAKRREG